MRHLSPESLSRSLLIYGVARLVALPGMVWVAVLSADAISGRPGALTGLLLIVGALGGVALTFGAMMRIRSGGGAHQAFRLLVALALLDGALYLSFWAAAATPLVAMPFLFLLVIDAFASWTLKTAERSPE